MKASLILCCAGKGERAGFSKNKVLTVFNGKSVLDYTLSAFLKNGDIDQIIITASKQDFDEIYNKYNCIATVVRGGATRSESVVNALKEVKNGIVLIHDGARPFVSEQMIKDCIEGAEKSGGVIPVIPTRDTVVFDGDGKINYLGKSGLFCVQTPQGFNTDTIKKAYAFANGQTFNDDGEVYKNYTGSLDIYSGDLNNIKLTYKKDFDVFSCVETCRVGSGFDCHELVEGRKLILGGIEIPHVKGLKGHSDADVLIHAIMDAILSACALRDIGYYFPDNDMQYKDIDSMKLLKKVLEIIDGKGFKVKSISAVIMAQKPKLLTFMPDICTNVANALSIDKQNVGISATTLEGLGFVGREEGICVYSTAVVVEK